MYKYLSTLLLTCFSIVAAAQETTKYYDQTWQETKKKKAKWHRTYTMEHGLYKIEDHYATGPIYMTGYRSNITSNSCQYREGAIVFYDKPGHKLREGTYKAGTRVGVWTHYYPGSDAPESEMHYLFDTGEHANVFRFDSAAHKLIHKSIYAGPGKSTFWDYNEHDTVYTESSYADSSYISTIHYKDRIVTEKRGKNDTAAICYNERGELIPCKTKAANDTFTYVEVMPKCNYDLNRYLAKNIKYPDFALNANIQGRAIVRFTIDEDGAIANVKIVKGVGGGCDDEAMRVVSEMPYWEPGYQNGKPVRVYFNLPIVFKVK